VRKRHRGHLSAPTMAFDPYSLLILKFRGRGVAVFRDRCADYDVSRPQSLSLFLMTVCLLTLIASLPPATTEYYCCRTTQLAALATPCSRRWRSHPPGINPRLSRHERGRTDQRCLADRELHRSFRDHCSRSRCVHHQ
jgi:hypothetical protein